MHSKTIWIFVVAILVNDYLIMKLSQVQTFIKTLLVLVVLFAGTRVASSSAFNISSQESGDNAGESVAAEENPIDEKILIEDLVE